MTSPVPVAIVLPDLGGGGAQRVMLTLAGGLDPARFAVRLIVIGGSQVFAGQVPRGIAIENLGAGRLLAGLPRLIRTLRRLQPRIVVSVMGYLNLSLLAVRPMLGRDVQVVIREANVLSATEDALPAWLPTRRLYRMLYPRAAAIVAPTKDIAEGIVREAPPTICRVTTLQNPVDESGLRKSVAPFARTAGSGLILVAAGRLTKQKGFDRLIAMMPSLPPDTRLTIFGEGPDRAALEAQIESLSLRDRVTLPGFSAALPAAIAGADLFVLPSRWEGLPNVVLEALALGTPVVASEEAAVSEIAASAAPGAVTVVPCDNRFAGVLARHRTAPSALPRPSLLPPAYRAEEVTRRFTDLLAGVAAT